MGFWDAAGEVFKGWVEKPSVSTHSGSDAQKELEDSYHKTKKDFEESYLATVKSYDFATTIVSRSIEYASEKTKVDFKHLPSDIISLLLDTTVSAVKAERFFDFPEYDFSRDIPLSRQIQMRNNLEQIKIRVYDNDEVLVTFYVSFTHALEHFLYSITSLVHVENNKDAFSLNISYALENLSEHLEQMIIAFFSEKNAEYGIFKNLQETLLNNADVASGFQAWRSGVEREEKPCTLPTKSKITQSELITAYLDNTYLKNLFQANIDFSIPVDLRMEHCHILAGTGHGKTQLLQKLILEDIDTGRGFMVIDSQGDMIHKISMMKIFDPLAFDSLSEKLIIIDPEDVEYPASLNMFALSTGENISNPLQKQMLINSTIDLYEYMFGALFGAEMTSKQGVIFRYVAKLMAEIPDATIHTLRNLLEDGKRYSKYIDRLDGSSKAFFDTQFFTPSFGQTKKQILSRLWAVLSNQTLENLFSSTENSIDLFNAISDGKIVLVNTSKQLLQSSGSQVLGRFFIALASQAVIKRATVPEANRKPYMVYVDEAQEYFDEKIEQMLNQARKYNIGFTLSHQNLGQLGHLKHTVFSSTSIKLAGGISAKDAKEMSGEMKCSPDFLLGMAKGTDSAEFACFLKNKTHSAIPLSYDFGLLENRAVMNADSYTLLIENIRKKYCSHISEIDYGSPPDVSTNTPEPVEKSEKSFPTGNIPPLDKNSERPPVEVQQEPKEKTKAKPTKTKENAIEGESEVVEVAPEGKGGIRHRYLQNLVKKIGQERGFYSVIENQVFDGLGSVDVSLEGFDSKIAIEVSVTTASDWEAGNITKCFSAGYDYVIILSAETEHLEKLKSQVTNEFKKQIQKEKLFFFQPEQLIQFLDEIKAKSAETEQSISGYKVKVNFTPSNPKEAQLREEAIAKVLLGKQ